MLILTPNRRLAAFLTQQFNIQQLAAGKPSWESAAIFRLEDWLNELWNICLETTDQKAYPILSKMQQQVLWEQIIQNSTVGVELLRVSSTAKNVLQAWKFLNEWQIPLHKIEPYQAYSPDVAAFYAWGSDYLAWLTEHNYLDFALMVNRLIAKLPLMQTYLPQEITLHGFDEIPPQYLNLFDTLKKLGINILENTNQEFTNEVFRTEFIDAETELNTVAAWAQQELVHNPEQLLGVVVPELETQRQLVERIFTSYFTADMLNISAPQSLNNYTLIKHALLILQLTRPLFNYSDFSVILRSPYINAASNELTLRASIDRELRQQLESRLSWSSLRNKVETYTSSLFTTITNLQGQLNILGGKHTADYWSQQIFKILNIWGWPGERDLSIEEADLYACWQDLLQNYVQLSIILQEHTFGQALTILQRLAGETPFLPAETGRSKVHVLGILEAAGIQFDQLWVTGMNRDTWPPDASPNPFIPAEILRQHDMPRSSPQRELKLARRLTATLQTGGKQKVTFSYPILIADQHTAASNLIVHLPVKKIDLRLKSSDNYINAKLESVVDLQAKPVANNQVIIGGSNILKLQAECPFKAFATTRLKAEPLAVPQLFLTAAQRGNIVHKVMENFWQQCKNHAELVSYFSSLKIDNILEDIINRVLQRWQKYLPQTLTASYIEIEAVRLQNLIKKWLNYEIQREPFVVKNIEQKLQMQLGPLQINLRIDRVDELANGELIVIDYKTGYNQIADWFSDPLLDPQMPLYAIMSGDQVIAMAIANLQIAELKFKGISNDAAVLPDVKELSATRYIRKAEDLSKQIALWQQQVMQTAQAFAAGIASVTPTNEDACKYCNLQALCRIYDC